MKTSIWDILTGVIMLGILCMIGAFVIIIINPNSAINPLRPPSLAPGVITPISLPSSTATLPGLPPTWTPIPIKEETAAPASTKVLQPTLTPAPTNTILVLPTFTPSKTPRVGIGGGTCSITYQDPPDNKTIKKSTPFDTRWTIKNTSANSWLGDSTDIRFVGGDRMHSGADLRDMSADVPAGGSFDLVISMVSPATAGSYVSNWSLSLGSRPVCSFYVTINVP
jgi:hypothetical protein